jgi:putative addiction module component (TIGR02574 family)
MAEARSSLVVAGCRLGRIGVTLILVSDADLAEILKLPAEERLRLVELIWESLRSTPDDVPLGEAHRVALDAELSDHQRDPSNVLTLEEVLSGIRKPQ